MPLAVLQSPKGPPLWYSAAQHEGVEREKGGVRFGGGVL